MRAGSPSRTLKDGGWKSANAIHFLHLNIMLCGGEESPYVLHTSINKNLKNEIC